ncbi:Piso0_003120 [Millerozyma farinosa CBS 7064]|uniref:Piso0_003120 protein n=1 Tax=Pichia sorbitophila (strain ATCC MYA-4447 / BCRC 22081 / CBS 7064 / NBRC 10061 / NRRL Y-12695) TaxID=559304 RepID=G8YKE4_PICSO|nr:Piso0_003120 [Millerozyma farinosa CBS 7064]CCE80789.1 Piso0_003120 [Millerozyma farinosa CBS 7064]
MARHDNIESASSIQADSQGPSGTKRRKVGAESSRPRELVNQVVRLMLMKEHKRQLIRREHIASMYTGRRVRFEEVLGSARERLEDTYGLTIATLPEKSRGEGARTAGRATVALTKHLSPDAAAVLGELWDDDIRERQPSTSPGDTSRLAAPGADARRVESGMTLLALCLLLVSENYMSEHELKQSLASFGVGDRPVAVAGLDLTASDLISSLVKKEYLYRDVQKTADSSEHVSYTVGRRALAEFPPTAMFNTIRAIYAPADDEDVQKKAALTIERAYRLSFSIPSDRDNSSPQNPDPSTQDPPQNVLT